MFLPLINGTCQDQPDQLALPTELDPQKQGQAYLEPDVSGSEEKESRCRQDVNVVPLAEEAFPVYFSSFRYAQPSVFAGENAVRGGGGV